jgi:hypothetical protein
MPYCLAPGLSFCTTDNRRVFLDVKRDRYFCLGDAADRSFARLIAGSDLGCEDLHLLGTLVQRGVLRTVETAATPVACGTLPTPRTSLFKAAAEPSLWPAVRALAAFLLARLRLRFAGLDNSLRGIARSKAKIGAVPDTRAAAETIAATFHHAAAFATTRDMCLPHSLAVAGACLRRNVPAALVLGVRLSPFGAHSWVQLHDAIVNDSIDNVRDYTPILIL